MTKIKYLLKQTMTYGISSIGVRLLSWGLSPYYSQVIEDKKFLGINAELMSIVALLNIVYMMGMETSFFRFSRDYNREEVNRLTNTSVLINSAIWSLIFILLATPIVDLFHYPGKEIYIYLLSITLFLENVSNISFAKLRLDGKATEYVWVKVGNVVLNVCLNIFFISIVYTGQVTVPILSSMDPVEMIFLANLIAWVVTFLYFSRDIIRHIGWGDSKLFIEIMTYSIPLIVVGLAGMINETMDRVMLKYLLPYSIDKNLEEVAIYSVNYKLAILMSLAIQAFRMGAEPFFFKESKNKQAPQTYAHIMDYFIIVCCTILVITCLNRELISLLNERSYKVGLRVLPLLLLANLFLGIYYNASVWFKVTDNTKKGAIIALIGAAITLISNYWMIPILGYVGSALATLFCYFTMMMICILWGQRIYPIPYHFGYNIGWIVLSWLYAGVVFHRFQGEYIALGLFSLFYLILAGGLVYRRFQKTKLSLG